jgi:hypothetical protein
MVNFSSIACLALISAPRLTSAGSMSMTKSPKGKGTKSPGKGKRSGKGKGTKSPGKGNAPVPPAIVCPCLDGVQCEDTDPSEGFTSAIWTAFGSEGLVGENCTPFGEEGEEGGEFGFEIENASVGAGAALFAVGGVGFICYAYEISSRRRHLQDADDLCLTEDEYNACKEILVASCPN